MPRVRKRLGLVKSFASGIREFRRLAGIPFDLIIWSSFREVTVPKIMAACVLSCSLFLSAQAQEWTDVFNGTDLTGLKIFGDGNAKAVNGIIQVSGGNGYLATVKEYTHFRTRVEWNNSGGNSGMLYHIQKDRVWPLGLECQMASGDVGSLWTTGCKFNSEGVGGTYKEGGAALTGVGTTGTSRSHFVKSSNQDKGNNKWQVWEMYVKGDSLEIKVNDVVVMRIWKLTINNGVPLDKGRLGLQIEGADVQWRNWKIQDLSGTTTLAPKPLRDQSPRRTLLFDAASGRLTLEREGGRALWAKGGRAFDGNGRFLRLLPVP
jgi:hypothetical protein